MSTFVGYDYDGSLNLLFYDEAKQSIFSVEAQDSHKPYLLTEPDAHLPKSKKIIGVQTIKKWNAIKDTEEEYGKVFTKIPSDIANVRGSINPSWEDHILYNLSYAYDNFLVYGARHIFPFNGVPYLDIKSGTSIDPQDLKTLEAFFKQIFEMPFPSYKRCAFDIEVKFKKGTRPNVRNPDFPIICITVVGIDGFHKTYLLSDKNSESGDIFYFDSEKEMIEEFFKDIEPYPFKITHGGDTLDMEYLLRRSRKLGIKNIPIIPKRDFYSFPNSVHIDTASFFINTSIKNYAFKGKYYTAKLSELAKVFLNSEKLEMPDFDTATPEEIGIYCYRDSELALALTTFNGNLVMNLLTMLCRVANMDMEHVNRKSISVLIRSYYHFFHRLINYIIPNSEEIGRFNPEDKKSYRGAIVLDPVELNTVGYHFDVWGIDFGSLYPMELVTHNISHDTVNCGHEECKVNKVPESDVYICTKKDGVLKLMFSIPANLRLKHYKPMLKAEQDPIKKSWLEAISGSLKVFLNAGYGVFGKPELEDLFCYPVPSSITAYSRQALKTAISEAEKVGGKVIIGHTDSIFAKGLTKGQVEELSKEVSEKLGIDFEIQGHYRFVSTWRKANYLTIDDKGKIDVTGMLGKKRHIPKFIKGKFNDLKQILVTIEDEGSLNEARKQIVRLSKVSKDSIMKDEVPLEDLAYEITLHIKLDKASKSSQDYKVARLIRDHVNPNIDVGDTISKVLTDCNVNFNGKEKVHYTALPLKLVKRNWINKSKYVEHLESIFGQILVPMGIEPSFATDGYEKIEISRWFPKHVS